MRFKITATIFLAIITVNNSENKFGTFKSKSSQNQGSSDHTDLIKTEIKKYMSECGADVSDEDGADSKYNNRNSSSANNNNNNNNNNGGNNNNSGRYGNNREQNDQQSHGSNAYGNQRGNSGYGQHHGMSYPSHDYGRDSDRDDPQTGFGSWSQGSYSNPHGNTDYNRSGYGSYNGNYGYEHDATGYAVRSPAGNVNSRTGNYGPGSHSPGSDHFNFDGGFVRPKRSDDDMECISQCIFGYLEVLDDNRSPSESAMIKWLQDHLPNDVKRIKALRDARRCFARLAASDNDDGCDFSRSLSKCLDLEIEK